MVKVKKGSVESFAAKCDWRRLDEKKLQLVWSSPVKKVQERCESSVGKRCLAIGRKSGKGKQESNEQ